MKDQIETNKALQAFGADMVEYAQGQLKVTRTIRGRKVRRTASGTLGNSLFYQVLKRREAYRIEFNAKGVAKQYAAFIHDGVNGTEVQYGSPYSFKEQYVNIEAVKQWMRVKPVRLRDKDGQFIPNTEDNFNNAAFRIARGIAKNGIPPVPYFQEAADRIYPKHEQALADAMAKDSITWLSL
jgi:hypothetical protein